MDTTKTQESANRPSTQSTAGASSKVVSARERPAVTERAKEVIEGTRQKLTHAYDRTATNINQTYGKAVDYGKEHPGRTSLLAFGVGIGAGLLLSQQLSHRQTARSRASRIVPPVMSALSQITAQLFRYR
jgi:ElaB/YqjD/DUF883 family membrane-anchored ribosome-binding protein